jgi:hypothetical protein
VEEVHFSLANKAEERGSTRTLTAIAYDALLHEAYLWSPVVNSFQHLGWDVAEKPENLVKRFLNMVEVTENERFWVECFDWSKFDHWVLPEEHLIIQEELMNMYRTKSEVMYNDRLDSLDVMELSRVRQFLDTPDGVHIVENPVGQDSGRYTTLLGNTIVNIARRAVLFRGYMESERRMSYLRGDDLFQAHGSREEAVKYITDFTEGMGMIANLKKQCVQHRTGIYFRVVFMNGDVRGMPARAVHGITSESPDKMVPGHKGPVERITSMRQSCRAAIRRGFDPLYILTLYNEFERYFSKAHYYVEGKKHEYVVRRDALRTAQCCGGLGVPGLEYDEPRFDLQFQEKKMVNFVKTNAPVRKLPGVRDGVEQLVKKAKIDYGLELTNSDKNHIRRELMSNVNVGNGDLNTKMKYTVGAALADVRTAVRGKVVPKPCAVNYGAVVKMVEYLRELKNSGRYELSMVSRMASGLQPVVTSRGIFNTLNHGMFTLIEDGERLFQQVLPKGRLWKLYTMVEDERRLAYAKDELRPFIRSDHWGEGWVSAFIQIGLDAYLREDTRSRLSLIGYRRSLSVVVEIIFEELRQTWCLM